MNPTYYLLNLSTLCLQAVCRIVLHVECCMFNICRDFSMCLIHVLVAVLWHHTRSLLDSNSAATHAPKDVAHWFRIPAPIELTFPAAVISCPLVHFFAYRSAHDNFRKSVVYPEKNPYTLYRINAICHLTKTLLRLSCIFPKNIESRAEVVHARTDLSKLLQQFRELMGLRFWAPFTIRNGSNISDVLLPCFDVEF